MKKNLLFTAAMLLIASFTGHAQCSFTPTITPNGLIMCPTDPDTLWTQPYDSYQWYRGGQPIPGATQQYYVTDYIQDAGYYFKVEATQSACTEMSDSVLVDGWAFLPPFVISYGDMSLCTGQTDSVIFEIGQPYTTNIQWFNNGVPIPGAHNDSLVVYGPGIYTVEGSPSVCPNYVASLGVPLDVGYYYTTPLITPTSVNLCSGTSDTLSSPDFATTYQWYKDGQLVQDSAISYLIVNATGNYHLVLAHDDSTCLMSSDTVDVQVYQAATISIIQSGPQLVAASTPTSVSNYQWYLNGSIIPGATNGVYLPTQNGLYTVTGVDSFCTVTSAGYNYVGTDVENIKGASVSVSPNPFISEIRVSSKVPAVVTIYSIDGKKLAEHKNVQVINVDHLDAGIYLVTVSNDEGRQLRKEKMIKMK